MKALIAIFSWVSSLFGTGEAPVQNAHISNVKPAEISNLGVHMHNPRTVVALEDTHFQPSR